MTRKPSSKEQKNDGAFYEGAPVTQGFTAVRQAGESVSVIFVLENGAFAHGDCAAVQYSGPVAAIRFSLPETSFPLSKKKLRRFM